MHNDDRRPNEIHARLAAMDTDPEKGTREGRKKRVRQHFVQRRKLRRGEIAENLAMLQLKALRDICRQEDLSIECAMATTLIVVLRLDEAIRTRTLGEWMGELGTLRKELRNLRNALRDEFGDLPSEGAIVSPATKAADSPGK